jgi:chemotaxis protein methyltransferase CheR
MEDPVLTEAQFKKYSDLLYTRTGISLPVHKLYLAEARLARFVGPGKPFAKHQSFFESLEADPDGDGMELFINALTTNFSYFCPDPIHFEALAWYIQERGPTSPALRFWSAASSTGEEAYSMAITLLRHQGHLPADTKILATDISTKVLAQAQTAQYPAETINRTLSPTEISRYFRDLGNGTVEVRPEVRAPVSFRHLNLKEPFPLNRSMDIVFLRNVLIYFDKASKEDVVHRIERILRPGGLLIVGLSESLVELKHPLKMLRNSLYQKTGV